MVAENRRKVNAAAGAGGGENKVAQREKLW